MPSTISVYLHFEVFKVMVYIYREVKKRVSKYKDRRLNPRLYGYVVSLIKALFALLKSTQLTNE